MKNEKNPFPLFSILFVLGLLMGTIAIGLGTINFRSIRTTQTLIESNSNSVQSVSNALRDVAASVQTNHDQIKAMESRIKNLESSIRNLDKRIYSNEKAKSIFTKKFKVIKKRIIVPIATRQVIKTGESIRSTIYVYK